MTVRRCRVCRGRKIRTNVGKFPKQLGGCEAVLGKYLERHRGDVHGAEQGGDHRQQARLAISPRTEQEYGLPKRIPRVERVADEFIDEVDGVVGQHLLEKGVDHIAGGLAVPLDWDLIDRQRLRRMSIPATRTPVDQTIGDVDLVDYGLDAN